MNLKDYPEEPRKTDPEVEALSTCMHALKGLTVVAQQRVLQYIYTRLVSSESAEPPPKKGTMVQ